MRDDGWLAVGVRGCGGWVAIGIQAVASSDRFVWEGRVWIDEARLGVGV